MPRGKVLGGTSSINATSYVRGAPEDYNGWAALGCRGWDFENVLPYFRRLEDFEGGADQYRGAGGPLSVSHIRSLHPLSRVLVETCVKAGMTVPRGHQRPAADGRGLRPGHPAPGLEAQRVARLPLAGQSAATTSAS